MVWVYRYFRIRPIAQQSLFVQLYILPAKRNQSKSVVFRTSMVSRIDKGDAIL